MLMGLRKPVISKKEFDGPKKLPNSNSAGKYKKAKVKKRK